MSGFAVFLFYGADRKRHHNILHAHDSVRRPWKQRRRGDGSKAPAPPRTFVCRHIINAAPVRLVDCLCQSEPLSETHQQHQAFTASQTQSLSNSFPFFFIFTIFSSVCITSNICIIILVSVITKMQFSCCSFNLRRLRSRHGYRLFFLLFLTSSSSSSPLTCFRKFWLSRSSASASAHKKSHTNRKREEECNVRKKMMRATAKAKTTRT